MMHPHIVETGERKKLVALDPAGKLMYIHWLHDGTALSH